MAITPGQIDIWLAAPSEHQNLEFKEARNQFDNQKLYKYCVALANEGGGRLLLGVTDKPPRRVVGTRAFNNTVDMAATLFRSVGFRVDIEEVSHPDGRVLVFHIPSRPRGTAYHLNGTYLMRSGEELVPMSEDKLRGVFAESGPDWLGELSKRGLSIKEVLELLDTHAFFKLLDLPYPTSEAGIIERLIQEKIIHRKEDGLGISRLGALLLAKRLEDFSELSRKAPRVLVYSKTSKLETALDQLMDQGYAVGFQDLIQFILKQIPKREVIQNALRQEIRVIPEIVIRELVANALIHQDFNIDGMSVMIEIYSNRIEISNPGEPIVPVERFIDGYQARNEYLAGLMRRMRICEEKSSGIDKVVHAAEEYRLSAPDFRVAYRRTVVAIFGPKDFENMDRDERIRACYQHCVLKWVMSTPMTNQSLRERFHLSENKSASVSQVIGYALEMKMIKLDERVGISRKHARYLPFWA